MEGPASAGFFFADDTPEPVRPDNIEKARLTWNELQEGTEMLEHLTRAKRNNYGPGSCKLAILMETLEKSDRDILQDCLNNPLDYSVHGIWQGLRSAGIRIGYATVSRHRAGLCPCGGA